MTKHEVGHTFLARLGKKRLRPGGIKATNWLIEQANLNESKKVLEVACNMCTTSMELAKTYGCHITAVDMDPRVLEKARHNISVNNLENKITLQQANAMKLPFENETFDVVFNEAMLTMLNGKSKQKAISEYYRVLKPGGILLTHDVMLAKEDMADTIESLRKTIHVNVEPLTLSRWEQVFKEEGFVVSTSHGDMSLMSPKGMIRDEGLLGTLKIIRNGLKKENRGMFKKMYSFFNHPEVKMEYIAVASRK
ncbi:class I SAM-dependent methyltransferase [Paenibacillus turicensis]|uniref:class I SAM-dependent methyltransferase n=1 Tax=Paenibacillus turicensis TaxID=160487 RepID=UPI003D283EDB